MASSSQIKKYQILGSMSKRRIPKYNRPKDSDISLLVYVNPNGDLMHRFFTYNSITGVFEWMDGVGRHQDFFSDMPGSDEDEDDQDEYYEDDL